MTESTLPMRRLMLDLLQEGRLDLPLPGGGETPQRFEALSQFAREDLSAARLAEAHTDAIAILAEAEHPAPEGLLGVWTSEGSSSRVRAVQTRRGWRLDGVKQYCAGLGIVDHALVTARGPAGHLLFLVPLDRAGVAVDLSTWRATALARTLTGTVRLSNVILSPWHVVGPAGFYLERPGFWHGAAGVAACWAGGAAGIAQKFLAAERDDVHVLAHAGAVGAECWAFGAVLSTAAREIDQDPRDVFGCARLRALTVRHLAERACREIIDRTGRALGPGPLVFDAAHPQRVADLSLYIRQHHAERDLELLGRLAVSRDGAAPAFDPGSERVREMTSWQANGSS